jgi:hypothetical protein
MCVYTHTRILFGPEEGNSDMNELRGLYAK